MSQFRKVPPNGFPYGKFEDPCNPLIMTFFPNGEASYSKTIDEKRAMLLDYKASPEDYRLLFPWVGKASTDVFEITEKDLPKLLDY